MASNTAEYELPVFSEKLLCANSRAQTPRDKDEQDKGLACTLMQETNVIVEQLIDKRELRGSFGSTQVIRTGEALTQADPRQGAGAVRGPE